MDPVTAVAFQMQARCNLCGWAYRTQVKSDFDQQLKWHRAGHQ